MISSKINRVLIVLCFLTTLSAAAQVELIRDVELDKADLPTLIDALGNALSSPILFGVELHDIEPKLSLSAKKGSSLDEALVALVRQLPGHRYERLRDNFVHIYNPDKASSVLDFVIPSLELKNEPPGNFLSGPRNYVPELDAKIKKENGYTCSGMGPGLGSTGPGVTMSLKNVTLRDALTAVALASVSTNNVQSPVGWLYVRTHKKDGTINDQFSAIRSLPKTRKLGVGVHSSGSDPKKTPSLK